MKRNRLRHGGLVALVVAGPLHAVPAPPDHQIPKIQSRRFAIRYRVNEAALPLTRAELWYSRDGGDTWHNYGLDEDSQSPIQFDATDEGTYGFYFVLENGVGSSGRPPQPGTAPQQWVFVDYTPPIVQLHPVQVDQRDTLRPRLQIRWTAIDAHFAPRPIELSYRIAPDGEWTGMGDHLSNTGRYDWHPPESACGGGKRLVVRLTARDRSGHRASAVARAVEFLETEVSDEASAAGAPLAGEPTADTLDPADRKRVEALLRRGLAHKERGEHGLAAARFQEALAIDPHMPEALVDLGETLYFREKYDDSIEAFEWAVKFEPGWTQARRGLIRALMIVGRHEDASAQLAHVLKSAPADAEAWLTLGDVAMSRSDELMARENWQKAATVDPAAEETVEQARARLADLQRMAAMSGPARK